MIQLLKDIGSVFVMYLEECSEHKMNEVEPQKVRVSKGYYYE